MVVHINQPRFLPALNYFQRMILADVFIYRDDVQFQRKDWESRNKIKTRDGWMWLSVPVICPKGMNICEARVDNSTPWAKQMLNSIRVYYGTAPHFKRWFPELEVIFCREWATLVALNFCLIEMFIKAWGIDCKFVMASDLGCKGDTDEILIQMLKKLGATIYLSGAEGREYNRPEAWKAAGIELRYHDYIYPVYPQRFGGFIPWMSALDLLMNCGADGRKYLEPRSIASAA